MPEALERRRSGLVEAGIMATPAKPKVSAKDQKAKLRVIFDKFDTDKSGHVSVDELKAMVKMLKLDMSDAAIKKMMADADVDASGQIDFAEFVAIVKKQSASGSAEGLASVVEEAGSAFGWLNPLNWFAAEAPPAAKKQTSKQQSAEKPPINEPARAGSAPVPGAARALPPARSPGRSASPTGSARSSSPTGSASPSTSKYYARTPESIRSMVDFVPTHRMKATQALVQATNAELHNEMKSELSVAQQRAKKLEARFLAKQQVRVEQAKKQQEETNHAVELLKYQKRYQGWEMKTEIKQKWELEQVKKAKFAEKANKRATSFKKRKARATTQRHKEQHDISIAASIASKVERSQRREESLSTKRAQEEQAKHQAAQVRFETRPEVRQEGREMFQAQRNATTAEVKQMLEENALKIAQQKNAYLEKQISIKKKVDALKAASLGSREGLRENRKQQATELRSLLEHERARMLELKDAAKQEVAAKHDSVYMWHALGIVEP